MNRYFLILGFWCLLLLSVLGGVAGCQHDDFQAPPQEMSGVGMSLRLLALPNTIQEVDFFLFRIPDSGSDTVLQKRMSIASQVASNLPLKVGVPMGKYVVVAVANAHGYISATPSATKLGDLMMQLNTSTVAGANVYTPAPECFWGINRNVRVGINVQTIIPMRRLVGKVVIQYIHGDTAVTAMATYIDGVPLSVNYSSVYSGHVQVGKLSALVSHQLSLTDSILTFPTKAPSILNLKVFRGAMENDYSANLDSLIRQNQVLYVTINGGEETKLNINSMSWAGDTTSILLDESPEANINNGINDYDPLPNDTLDMRAVDFSVIVNGGIPANYTTNFVFKLKKLLPAGSTLNKTVAMRVVDGKLKTITPVYLNHGTYEVSGYLLTDADGQLPDPRGKSVAVSFKVALNRQVVQLELDGRQAVENAYMRLFCNALHGTGQTDGSIWPGTALYATDPIPATFPSASSGITNSSWYTGVDNIVQLQPIRGEWRVYSICYRGFTSALNGVLTADFCNLLYLNSINIRNNNITGSLPAAISALTRLNTLSVGNNLLSGTIDVLKNNTQLIYILVNNNQFSGSIATGLSGSMPVLVYLAINNNQFTGTLASVKINIAYLYAQNNQFSGSLPAFSNLINLVTSQIDVRYNLFSCYANTISATAASARINPQWNVVNSTTRTIGPC